MPARRLTYANVTSTVALVLAAAGSSYAAVALPTNSVGPRQLRPNAVTARALATGAVGQRALHSQAVTTRTLADGAVAPQDLRFAIGGSVASSPAIIGLPGGVASGDLACGAFPPLPNPPCSPIVSLVAVTVKRAGAGVIELQGLADITPQGPPGQTTSTYLEVYRVAGGPTPQFDSSERLAEENADLPDGKATVVPIQGSTPSGSPAPQTFVLAMLTPTPSSVYPATLSAAILPPNS